MAAFQNRSGLVTLCSCVQYVIVSCMRRSIIGCIALNFVPEAGELVWRITTRKPPRSSSCSSSYRSRTLSRTPRPPAPTASPTGNASSCCVPPCPGPHSLKHRGSDESALATTSPTGVHHHELAHRVRTPAGAKKAAERKGLWVCRPAGGQAGRRRRAGGWVLGGLGSGPWSLALGPAPGPPHCTRRSFNSFNSITGRPSCSFTQPRMRRGLPW